MFAAALVAAAGATLAVQMQCFIWNDDAVDEAPVVAVARPIRVKPAAPPLIRIEDNVNAREALSTALARHDIGANDVSLLVAALKGTLDVRGIRAGAPFVIEKDEAGVLRTFQMRTSSSDGVPRSVRAVREAAPAPAPAEAPRTIVAALPAADAAKAVDSFRVEVVDAHVDTRVEGVAGTVQSSLYNAMLQLGEDANLVNRFVDVFAWNIDFYRQQQPGDEFRVLVEKRYAEDKFLGYGKVVAAEYVNAGTVFRGFNFTSQDGKISGTFDDAGGTLQRVFLKSPMEIARITSRYGMRFHPVLKHNRAHQGIDYGAPVGTPVWSVADGVVIEARYSSSAGNMVVVRHTNGFTTEYFHLSRFAEGIHAGVRVKQKQLVGYVGSSGLSTGPHLHFGMLRSGAHVDPARQKFDPAKPLPHDYMEEFRKMVEPLLADLKALDRV